MCQRLSVATVVNIMGRPKKILSDEMRRAICTDLDFSKAMLCTTKLTVSDIEAVLRHIDMVRDDLIGLIVASQTKSKD